MKKPRYWRQGERLRAIFFILAGFILLWGIIDLFTTVGVVDADTLWGVAGIASANILLFPRLFASVVTIPLAMLHPLVGYLFVLLGSIVFIISGIRDLLKPL